MPVSQERYDDAMFAFSQGDYSQAIDALRAILAEDSQHFDAQLSLGMALCRQGDFAGAILEGHKAEKLRPHEQLVHTNLSLFYMRSGDKQTAEHHGLQARIASWKGNMDKPAVATAPAAEADAELKMAGTAAPQAFKLPEKFPDMPWKKKKPPATGDDTVNPSSHSH